MDQDPLPRLDVSLVAQTLQRSEARDGDGCRLLERQTTRLGRQIVLGSRRVLSETATPAAEDVIAGFESRDVLSDRLDVTGQVRAPNAAVGHAHEPGDDVRQ